MSSSENDHQPNGTTVPDELLRSATARTGTSADPRLAARAAVGGRFLCFLEGCGRWHSGRIKVDGLDDHPTPYCPEHGVSPIRMSCLLMGAEADPRILERRFLPHHVHMPQLERCRAAAAGRDDLLEPPEPAAELPPSADMRRRWVDFTYHHPHARTQPRRSRRRKGVHHGF